MLKDQEAGFSTVECLPKARGELSHLLPSSSCQNLGFASENYASWVYIWAQHVRLQRQKRMSNSAPSRRSAPRSSWPRAAQSGLPRRQTVTPASNAGADLRGPGGGGRASLAPVAGQLPHSPLPPDQPRGLPSWPERLTPACMPSRKPRRAVSRQPAPPVLATSSGRR